MTRKHILYYLGFLLSGAIEIGTAHYGIGVFFIGLAAITLMDYHHHYDD